MPELVPITSIIQIAPYVSPQNVFKLNPTFLPCEELRYQHYRPVKHMSTPTLRRQFIGIVKPWKYESAIWYHAPQSGNAQDIQESRGLT
jgi:hypothetical protein